MNRPLAQVVVGVILLPLLLAACSSQSHKSAASASDPFDVHVLTALRNRNLDQLAQTFPPSGEPAKNEVNASYNMPASPDDPTIYTVLINRKRHVIWLRRNAGDSTLLFGPIAVNAQ